jgi:viologen exporter family transport system ATP-binding protein
MIAVETRDLRKSYVAVKRAPGIMGSLKSVFRPERTSVDAVKGIDLEIQQGELVGFLGPNGAGKTTTLKMLSGILFPTSGEAKVLGYTPFDRKPEMLRQIAMVVGNKNQLWWDLPAIDSFQVLKELYEVSDADFKRRSEFLIETLELNDKIQIQVRKLSLGERMKCELVAALLHSPRVLFLDEPTIGLDVVSQKRIRDFLKQLHREENCTMILTSHYMQDVEALCERVIIIDQGAKIFEGTLASLGKEFSAGRRLRLQFSEDVALADLARYGTVVEAEGCSAVLEVQPEQVASVTGAVLGAFPVNDVSIEDVDVEEIIRKLFERQHA